MVQIRKEEVTVKTGWRIDKQMQKNYNDGKRIFVNRLIYYAEDALQENMITFYQLMFKDLGYFGKMKG